MADFQVKDYWNNRYATGGNSGNGSYGSELAKKLKWLRGWAVNSISEIGCGDFNFGKHLLEQYPDATYYGYDISKVILDRNKIIYPEYTFGDLANLPSADLLLCMDVLFHIIDDKEYEEMLERLSHFKKYLAVTAYENAQETSSHLKIRPFDYKQFGEPIIRQIVEEDGQKYLYLFEQAIDLSKISCVLITKDSQYPQIILDDIRRYPFGQVIILTNSDSPYRKHEMFERAKFDLIYYQDDDCIAPIEKLVQISKPDMINVAMKQEHYEQYKNTRMTMGLGWGAIFPKKILKSLSKYTDKYGEDALFKRETERILTYLNYPQNRLVLPITDLPSAYAADRLWRQPGHYENISLVEQRCKSVI